jgi:hypothetical protein
VVQIAARRAAEVGRLCAVERAVVLLHAVVAVHNGATQVVYVKSAGLVRHGCVQVEVYVIGMWGGTAVRRYVLLMQGQTCLHRQLRLIQIKRRSLVQQTGVVPASVH